ncbi:MAG: hypothetical protein JXB49_26535 [Bacteroidales bacterium]|nr:hypothetical protein [Bacteroidales bacterium]
MKIHKKLIIVFAMFVAIGIVGTAIATTYTAYTSITNVSISSYSDYDQVYAGQKYYISCTASTDSDCSDEGGWWHIVSDPITHTWSGDGTFDPPGTGTAVYWTAPSTPGYATITVTADDSPLYNETSKADSVILEVIAKTISSVKIFTSVSYDDNSGDGLNDCQVHFGERTGSCYPSVYMEISMNGGTSRKIDQFDLTVTSESDSTGISVEFTETGYNTDTYRTTLPIHLSTSSYQGNLELQVLDEETLYVEGTAGPKVDRGEVATISAYCFSGSNQDLADDGADAVSDYFTDCSYWWNNGDPRNITSTSTFGNFIKNVGSYASDFLFSVSHGNAGNFGYISGVPSINKPTGGTPTITSYDWDDDVEWIITYCCHGLGQEIETTPAAWIGYWDDALKNKSGDNIPHAILSSSDSMWASPTEDHMIAMCEAIEDDETICDAYYDTAMDVTPIQWATSFLCNNDNLYETINNVSTDSQNTSFSYYYYTEFEGYGELDPNDIYWGGGGKFTSGAINGYEILCDIPADQPSLKKVSVRKEVLNQNALNHTGFKKVKSDNSGRIQFKKDSVERGQLGLTMAQAHAKANSFIEQKGGGKPADADVVLVGKSMVLEYDSKDFEGTKREYVNKGIFEYRHKVNGIEVVGGNRGDSIFVTVKGQDVVSYKRHWRDIIGPVGASQKVIPASDALEIAVKNIPNVMLDGLSGYSITNAKLFYYGLPSEQKNQYLTPAWGFQLNKRLWVYVDAFTGEFLK